ncbi:MAG: hypothetical protein RR630_01165 [Coprobacillus sp.]
MKKILVCFTAVFCCICLLGQKVSAANTYTQKQIAEGGGPYEAGAVLQFEEEVKVSIVDLEGNNIFSEKGKQVVLPDYSPKMDSFKGWALVAQLTSEQKGTELVFQPYFKLDIQFNEVTEGNPITVSVSKDQIPFGDGKYTTEWIVGGMGGGYAIEEAPKNTLTWTIPAGSTSYKNGMKIALRVRNEKSKNIFSEEAVLVISAKAPIVTPSKPETPSEKVPTPAPTTKPSQDKEIVKTNDLQSVFTNTLLVIGSIGVIVATKRKATHK